MLTVALLVITYLIISTFILGMSNPEQKRLRLFLFPLIVLLYYGKLFHFLNRFIQTR